MKSITQVAEELKVSNKTIQRYIKKLNITTEKQGTERLVADDAIKRIGQAIQDNKTRQQDNSNNEIQRNKTRQDNKTIGQLDCFEMYKIQAEMLQSQLEHMHSEIALLNEQLQVKDNQLNIKDKQIEQHLQTIQALTGQIDRLTTQIETAHQLNAGNIKALLNEQDKFNVDVSKHEEQPQKKQSFFSKLFRKGK